MFATNVWILVFKELVYLPFTKAWILILTEKITVSFWSVLETWKLTISLDAKGIFPTPLLKLNSFTCWLLCSRVLIGRVYFIFLILASSLLSKSTPKLSKDEDGDLWGSIAAPAPKSSKPLSLKSTVTDDDDPWASIAAPAPTTKAKQINRTTSLAEDGVLNLLLQS